MSIPQLLAMTFQTTAPQAKVLTGGNTQLLGNTFSSAATYNAVNCAQARIVQFNGALYAISQSNVFRSTDFGQTWSSVLAPASISAASTCKQIYVCQINGVANVCIAYGSTDVADQTVRLARSADGVNWTSSASASTIYQGTSPCTHGDFIDRGSVYAFADAGDFYHYTIFNFNNLTATRSTISFATIYSLIVMPNPEFAYFNGSLYTMIGNGQGASAAINLARVDGTTYTTVASLTTSLPSTSSYQTGLAKSGVFSDGTNIYSLYYYTGGSGTNTTGFRCVRFTSTFVATDITFTVVPGTMLGNTNVIPSTARVRTVVDTLSDPTSPQIYIWYCADASGASTVYTPWTIYRWINDSTPMEFVDVGSSFQDAIPFTKTTEGSTFYTTDNGSFSSHAEILSRATTNSGTAIRLTFKLYSSTGTQLVDVTGHYGNNVNEWATQPATLSNPSSGSLVGNTIENLMADNGITTYAVTWESNTDGIGNGDAYKFVFRSVNSV